MSDDMKKIRAAQKRAAASKKELEELTKSRIKAQEDSKKLQKKLADINSDLEKAKKSRDEAKKNVEKLRAKSGSGRKRRKH